MRITTTAKITIIGRPDPTEMNGKRYFKLSFLCNGEAGTMSCTEDAYNIIGSIQDGQFVPVVASFVYNDKYNSMSINAVSLSAPAGKSGTATLGK